ncbi:hypothetical protein A3L12_01110 [Thermococcus sp. P6]|uniref:hypothetical protein n=1 Tax=Thermococcus sp. P6 TaxID=122420 RepID=UPI000B59D7B9|nr:hypothetical protein [Thermococcus sp. P6]ASJ09994.1 hypothetical protein A3L12_01110 [Thermococcus sp. P6]
MRLNSILWGFLITYTLCGIVAKLIFNDLLPSPRLLPLIYALAFSGAMVTGYMTAERFPVRVRILTYGLVVVLVLSALGSWGFLMALPIVAAPPVFAREEGKRVKERLASASLTTDTLLIVAAVALVAFPLVTGRVPLLHPGLRYTGVRFFYLASGYLIAAAISLRGDFRVFLLGLFVAVVSTFRTVAVAVTVTYLLRLMGEKRTKPGKGLWLKLSVITAGVLIVFLVRYQATLSTYPEWRLGFFGTLLHRMGLTYSVYERLFSMGMPWGNPEILLSKDPKGYVGRLFGSSVGYSYTIFGQPSHDFGVFGIVEGFLLGGILRDAEWMESTKVLALTLFILMVPIGIDAFFLPAVAFLAYSALGGIIWERTGSWL